MKNPMKVITGKNTRFSYLNVNEPKSINGGTAKYSVSLIIPKSDTITIQKIKAAIKAAYEDGQAKLRGNGKSVPALDTLKTPLRDGDKERPDDEAYAMMIQGTAAPAQEFPITYKGKKDFLGHAWILIVKDHPKTVSIDFSAANDLPDDLRQLQ